jgi:hypothetical protein
MASLLRAAQERAKAKRERQVLLEVPSGIGVSLLCATVTGEQIARLLRQAKKRHPGDEMMQGLAANTALLAQATVEIVVDDETQEDEDGNPFCGNRAEIVEIVESLRLARVDRIIHCDVDDIADLRIEARPGDVQDAEQTEAIRAEAERVLGAYRALMCELRARGFEVLRHVMIGGHRG